MRPAITFAAQKSLAIVVSGLVVLGGGSIALAAATSETEPDPVLEAVVEEPCVEDETTTETECPVVQEPCVEDETTTETECPADPVVDGEHPNHGAAVSEAARETCPKGPGHGACVSDVARSDVGKKHAEPEAEVVEPAETDETDEEPAGAEASDAESPAKGNGKGGGNGAKKR